MIIRKFETQEDRYEELVIDNSCCTSTTYESDRAPTLLQVVDSDREILLWTHHGGYSFFGLKSGRSRFSAPSSSTEFLLYSQMVSSSTVRQLMVDYGTTEVSILLRDVDVGSTEYEL